MALPYAQARLRATQDLILEYAEFLVVALHGCGYFCTALALWNFARAYVRHGGLPVPLVLAHIFMPLGVAAAVIFTVLALINGASAVVRRQHARLASIAVVPVADRGAS